MTIFYMDYENGDDTFSGSSWAYAWKTITNGATAARIAPGDIIRIAKSGSPTSIGTATWTDLSKTVSLTSGSLNPNIDRCEVAWTANPSGDTTVTRTAVATDAKEGSYCMKLALDSSPQTNVMQAYYATGLLNLSAFQKISFWFKNSASSTSADWIVRLCEDTAGSSVVDSFPVPAVPSTARWLPLTLARTGGGNCGSAIQSISISTGSIAPTASSNILVDNFIACTTDGLNLQSLISKNSLESGGTETWYGLQSINGSTLMLDNETNTLANTGRGYSGSTETVATYKRETIKTSLASSTTTAVQDVQDTGTLGNNIQFQGGYNTSTSNQDGETFFDGLNGYGYGLLVDTSCITINRLSTCRYYDGMLVNGSTNLIITSIMGANNNTMYGFFLYNACGNSIMLISGINNNGQFGIYIQYCSNNIIGDINQANNNGLNGIAYQTASDNKITNAFMVKNNGVYGVQFQSSSNNYINTLITSNNASSALATLVGGKNFISNATLGETTKITPLSSYDTAEVCIDNIGGYSQIWTYAGNIVSQNATAGGTGLEWKMSVTSSERASSYPLKLKLAGVAINENSLATVTAYFKKSHATDIAGALVCSGSQIAGVSASVVAYCPSDTTRNPLQIQFTPSGSGVVEIEAWAWWAANTADENIIVDDIQIS